MTHTYVPDGSSIIEERVSTGQTLRYVEGLGVDEHLAVQDGAAVTYYVTDHVGSVVQETSSAGAVTLARKYDPWGNLLSGASTAGWAYTGREWDPEAGLYYYRARYYDPGTGRFSSEDPIGANGGPNLYTYVSNAPMVMIDPNGLQPVQVDCSPSAWRPVRLIEGRSYIRNRWARKRQTVQIPGRSGSCLCIWVLVGAEKVTEQFQELERDWTCKGYHPCVVEPDANTPYTWTETTRRKWGDTVEQIPTFTKPRTTRETPGANTTNGCRCDPPKD